MAEVETVQKFFYSRLTTTAVLRNVPTAWENAPFMKPAAELWFRVNFMPAMEKQRTLGTLGSMEMKGLLQVTVCVPNGVGELDSRKKISLLRTCFSPKQYELDGVRILITRRYPQHGRLVDGYWQIPFVIHWSAILPL